MCTAGWMGGGASVPRTLLRSVVFLKSCWELQVGSRVFRVGEEPGCVHILFVTLSSISDYIKLAIFTKDVCL